MFAGYNDAVEGPSKEDAGKFIPQKEIEVWWASQQKKFPGIYSADDPSPQQHPFNSRLMQYVDDDPNHAVRIEIKGSQWRKDKRMGKTPMYIVIVQDGKGDLTHTELTSAHEGDEIGWQLGWDLPPPTGEDEE
jgi:hypothetical protein